MQGSPRLLKGAIVSVDALNPPPRVVAFQYNPDTLTRSFQVQGAGDGGERSEAYRITGAPVETLKLDVEIDATDALARGDQAAASTGVYPQLAALEALIYPAVTRVVANAALLAAGSLELVPPAPAMTLLIWGARRVLPVRITDLSVVEEAHDPSLNPLRAKVSLGLRVLSYDDLSVTHPGYHLFVSHQVVKEALARAGQGSSLDAVLGHNVNLTPTV